MSRGLSSVLCVAILTLACDVAGGDATEGAGDAGSGSRPDAGAGIRRAAGNGKLDAGGLIGAAGAGVSATGGVVGAGGGIAVGGNVGWGGAAGTVGTDTGGAPGSCDPGLRSPPPLAGASAAAATALLDALHAKRQALIRFLWGSDGFPSTKLPTAVDKNVVSPVGGLSNLERVDTLHIDMEAGLDTVAHHFIPSTSGKDRLVIVHHGHATSFDDDSNMDDVGYGMQRTINNLLIGGYSVLAMYMPGCLPTARDCEIDHTNVVYTPTTGSGMKFFVEPVAVALNYLEARGLTDGFPAYRDFSMIGLSGGGWTTTIYAALDPRIQLSVPIAGSLPLPLRYGSSWGDEEQTHAPFYEIAGYTDLYALGGLGIGRRQVQVLNRYDNNCFGQHPDSYDPGQTGMSYDDALRGYEADVRRRLADSSLGAFGDSFRLEIDDVAPGHMISWNALASILLPELERGNGPTAPSAGDGFIRSPGGTLVHVGAGGAEDTAFPMVGQPAFVRRDAGTFDVFFRDPMNRLMHASNENCTWMLQSLDTAVITDPVAVKAGPGRFDVVALTPDYVPHHWHGTARGLSSASVTTAPKTFGPPVMFAGANNRIDLFLQDWRRTSHHLYDDGSCVWCVDSPAP